eukprot:1016120-Karenia_brevis.AAC.1
MKLGCNVYVKRVSTHNNIADLPSRGMMDATPVEAKIHEIYWRDESWSILNERWQTDPSGSYS